MMDNMLQKIIDFIKKETVLTIATVLAVASAFWVHPGPQYVGYIDWRVLGILLSLMLIVAGFQSNDCSMRSAAGFWQRPKIPRS